MKDRTSEKTRLLQGEVERPGEAAICAGGFVVQAEVMKDLEQALLSEAVLVQSRIMVATEQYKSRTAYQ